MDHHTPADAHRPPLREAEGPPEDVTAPEDDEELDEDTLAAIGAVDRNADPLLSAIIRDALELAEEEERQRGKSPDETARDPLPGVVQFRRGRTPSDRKEP